VDGRVVARDRVADAADGAERGRRLLRVLVVAERNSPTHAAHPDLVPAGFDLAAVVGEHSYALVDREARRRDVGVGCTRGRTGHQTLRRAERVEQRDGGEVVELTALDLRAPRDAARRDRAER